VYINLFCILVLNFVSVGTRTSSLYSYCYCRLVVVVVVYRRTIQAILSYLRVTTPSKLRQQSGQHAFPHRHLCLILLHAGGHLLDIVRSHHASCGEVRQRRGSVCYLAAQQDTERCGIKNQVPDALQSRLSVSLSSHQLPQEELQYRNVKVPRTGRSRDQILVLVLLTIWPQSRSGDQHFGLVSSFIVWSPPRSKGHDFGLGRFRGQTFGLDLGLCPKSLASVWKVWARLASLLQYNTIQYNKLPQERRTLRAVSLLTS